MSSITGQSVDYAWRQVSPNRWQLEIDEAEQFYACIAKSFEASGRMFFAITGFVSVSIPVPPLSSLDEICTRVDSAFRDAWLRLRYESPTIASKVHFNEEVGRWMKTYDSLPAPPRGEQESHQREAWLARTFVPISTNGSGLQWCNFGPPAPRFPTLFVIAPTTGGAATHDTVRRELIIRSPHDVMDGIGTLQLLDNLLYYTAEAYEHPSSWEIPLPGSEVECLSPPLRVAACIPPELSRDQHDRLKAILEKNASLKSNMDLLVMPSIKHATVPGKHQRVAIQLSHSETVDLPEAAKSLEATVTHLYHAGIVILLRDLSLRGAEPRQARYISYGLVNERSKCRGEYATSKHAAAVYHSVSGESLTIDITVPSMAEQEHAHTAPKESQDQDLFRDIVVQVKHYYVTIRNDKDALTLSPSFWAMGTPRIDHASQQITSVPPPNLQPSVSISSMGVLDKTIEPQHGPLKVSDPWVTGEELGPGLGLFLGSWEGRLSLSAAHNDAWHDTKDVSGYLDHIQGIVLHNLGLSTYHKYISLPDTRCREI